jgi:hypothetical protein
MFTRNEFACIARVLYLTSRLLTSPYAFKGGALSPEVPGYKKKLRAFRFSILVLELIAILVTLPTTIATKSILPIIAHVFYITLRMGYFIPEANIIFYGRELQVLINQTLMTNAGLGSRFLGRKELVDKQREVYFFFLFTGCLATATFSQMFGLFLIFWDLPFTVYPGTEALRGNFRLLILIAAVRVAFFLEELGPILANFIGIFCMTSTLFWLKKAW